MAIPRRLGVPALAASLIGAGFLTGRPDDADFYRSLKQAPFAPPSWAFGPAWVVAKTGVGLRRGARRRHPPPCTAGPGGC